MFANVVSDIEGSGAPGPLTYAIPDAMRAVVGVGTYVQVPLGSRQVLGYVVGLQDAYDGPPAKPITAVLHPDPVFDASLLHLASWMADRYRAALSETLRCIVPEGIATRLRTTVALQGVPDAAEAARSLERRSPALASLVRILGESEAVDVRALRDRWGGKDLAAALGRLRARGWIREQVALDSQPARARAQAAFRLVPSPAIAEAIEERKVRAPAQARALDLLIKAPGGTLLAADAARQGIGRGALAALAREGLVEAITVTVRRDPWRGEARAASRPELTAGQAKAVRAIEETIQAGQHDTILLHGVTASGKTEVYLRAIEAALARGRDAIVLLPEIALTAQVVEVFKGRLGDRVALLHSRLSTGERYDEWQRLRTGEARVAVGPRSALFAPCRNPGVIVLDEEHEPSYKQENAPRYHARRTALQRARAADAVLVLGSATPSVESYYLASREEYRLLSLPERVPGRSLPAVRIVDMRGRPLQGAQGIFSDDLQQALADCVHAGRQAVLFLNRRGFASFILCRDCGYTARCPNCSVSLTLHVSDHSLRCHHCNHRRPAPDLCPKCGGERIRPFGPGTERVEEAVRALLPEARVLRMDRDTTSAKDAHTRLYRAFRSGECNVLIGTQMVAKGLDFPGVTLVGVVAADGGLNIPDFRAAERTFQLLTQVAGRAGRGDHPGEVIIQTFNPEHYAIVAACAQDYEGFYAREIEFRRELGYPPFGVLVNILSTDRDSGAAEERAERAARAIGRAAAGEQGEVEVLGPAPAPLSRIKQRFRWHVLVRGRGDERVRAAVRNGLDLLSAADRDALAVDVDPMSVV